MAGRLEAIAGRLEAMAGRLAARVAGAGPSLRGKPGTAVWGTWDKGNLMRSSSAVCASGVPRLRGKCDTWTVRS